MPLVTLTGLPGSGKTTVAVLLEKHFKSLGHKTCLINEESLCINKNEGYKNAYSEKLSRGALKSAVDHAVNKDTIVILDSLNYIKGFRYELYCLARSQSTQHCVVWVNTPVENARKWNADRTDGEGFSADIFEDFVGRYEAPIDTNRWDKPLFVVTLEMLLNLPSEQSAVDGGTTDAISSTNTQADSQAQEDNNNKTETSAATQETKTAVAAEAAGSGAEKEKGLVTSFKSSMKFSSGLKKNRKKAGEESDAQPVEGADEVEDTYVPLPPPPRQPDLPPPPASKDIPFDAITDALLHGIVAAQSQATLSNPLSETNFLHELDIATQEIVAALVAAQRNALAGDAVTVPRTQKRVWLCRKAAMPELRRLRRQFMKLSTAKPPTVGEGQNVGELVAGVFVDYINASLEQEK